MHRSIWSHIRAGDVAFVVLLVLTLLAAVA